MITAVASKTIKFAVQPSNNSEDDERFVTLVRMARSDSSVEVQVQTLMRLYRSGEHSSPEMKVLAKGYLLRVNKAIQELSSARVLLVHLAGTCYGDDRPYCPILNALAFRIDTPPEP